MQEVIKHINATIIAHINDDELADNVKVYDLAESIAVRGEEEVTIPALVLPDGECINVYAEVDKHDVTCYHRLNSISFQEESVASFGSANGYTETDDMSLIVFGKRASISPFDMERIARKAIAQEKGCAVSQSDFNSLQIFASEYIGVTYFMSPEYYLFKINYRITSTYNPKCY